MGSGALDPQGPVAESMADLWWLMLWLGVAVFAVFAVLLTIGLLRTPTAAVTEQRAGRWLTGWGVIGPAVVIVVVFAATIAAMRAVPSEAPADAVSIDVVAHQWFYEVRYPEQGVAATNELHLPVGRPVALRLISEDVIHSFWVPELGGKMDMLPDGVNTLVLQADEPGEHISRCAEFCGLEHATMQLAVVAEPAGAFETWVGDQTPIASAALDEERPTVAALRSDR